MTTSRPAFATMTAIIVLGLVTTALAALVMVSRGEHQRTESSLAQAQLRQMVLAATLDAGRRSSSWGDTPKAQEWMLDMPGVDGAVQMNLRDGSANELIVQITALIGKNRVVQTLRYARTDSRWNLVEVKPL